LEAALDGIEPLNALKMLRNEPNKSNDKNDDKK
jgi:hypothetical protein